jgi:hypothetical protein
MIEVSIEGVKRIRFLSELRNKQVNPDQFTEGLGFNNKVIRPRIYFC